MARELLDDILKWSIVTGSDHMLATSARIDKKWGKVADLSLYHSVNLSKFEKAVAFLQQRSLTKIFQIRIDIFM